MSRIAWALTMTVVLGTAFAGLRFYFSNDRLFDLYTLRLDEARSNLESQALQDQNPQIWATSPVQIARFRNGHLQEWANNRYPIDSALAFLPADTSLVTGQYAIRLAGPPSDRLAVLIHLPSLQKTVAPDSPFPFSRETVRSKPLQWILLILLTLAIISLGIALHHLALGFSKRFGPWTGLGFLALTVGPLRLASIEWNWTRYFDQLFLFEPVLYGGIHASVGDLLLTIVLMLWLMNFVHREFRIVQIPAIPNTIRFVITLLHFITIQAGILFTIFAFRNVVQFSRLSFDFDRIFALGPNSILALLALILLLLVLFLFSHRTMAAIFSLGVTTPLRWLAFVISLAGAGATLWIMAPQIPLLQFALISLIFVGLLDYFMEEEDTNLVWLMGWLFVFALVSAILLLEFHGDREKKLWVDYARALSDQSDPLLDAALAEWHSAGAMPDYVRQYYQVIPLSGSDSFSGNHLFHTTWVLPDSTKALGFRPQKASWGTPLEALAQPPPYKGLSELALYDYAVYRRGQAAEQGASQAYPPVLSGVEQPPPGQYFISGSLFGARTELFYCADENTCVRIGKSSLGLLKAISIFSYLFVCLILVSLILAGFHLIWKILPPELDFTRGRRKSLTNRIQLWILLFLILSFIAIGVVSSLNFRQSANYREEVEARQKMETIRDLMETGSLLPDSAGQWAPVLEKLRKNYGIDLHLFDAEGRLMASSARFVFENNQMASLMSPMALQAFRQGASFSIQAEQTGYGGIRTAYFPLSGQGPAYAGFPFQLIDRPPPQEVADFIGTLSNVYVFLLLITAVAGLFLANSITRPITELGEALGEVKLGKNEPLRWDSNDEIGALIGEYNLMLEKLEQNAAQLAQTERDRGWRQMARQAAHEIKNPLTPMKLRIQHLQYAFKANPERAKELVEGSFDTLIHQIDSMDRIATSFLDFAKMPEPKNTLLSLTEVVQNVFELYSHTDRPNTRVELDLDPTPVWVLADRDFITRVLVNLFQNAIQALPPGKAGHIIATLHTRDGLAVVCVSDNGTGIPAEIRDKIFKPMFTTKQTGTGLGLDMSKNIIESAGGRIYFETREAEGTDFYVELPLAKQSA